jgi:hypothetical protein
MLNTHAVPYEIGKEGLDWMVMRTDNSEERPIPGRHHLRWRLSDQAIEKGVVAHFQFTDPAFVMKREDDDALTEHWTARLDAETPELTLDLHPDAKGRTFHYAVMVVADDAPHWAIGNNPPPKIEVGG